MNRSVAHTSIQQRKDAFATLLLWDTVRGADSTGIALVPKWNEEQPAVVYKKAMIAQDFLDLRGTKQLLDRASSQCALIGHNRAATRGLTDHESAHPFQVGPITLAHNGTLTSYNHLAKAAPAQVDSAYIAAGMAEHGEKETLEKLNGSFALVWHNAETQTINIARNDERPLVWCYDQFNTLWWASEWHMLFSVLHRTDHKFTSKFIVPSPYHWYQFKMDNTREVTRTPFAEASPKVFVTPPAPAGTASGGATKSGTSESKERLTRAERKAHDKLDKLGLRLNQLTTAKPKSWTPYKKHKKQNLGFAVFEREATPSILVHNVKLSLWGVIKERPRVGLRFKNIMMKDKKVTVMAELWEPKKPTAEPPAVTLLVPGPDNRMVTAQAFMTLTDKGCQQCGTSINITDAKTMSWYGDSPSPICPACTEQNMKWIKEGTLH